MELRISDQVCEGFLSTTRELFELSIPPCEVLLQTEGFYREDGTNNNNTGNKKSGIVYIVSSLCRMLTALLGLTVSSNVATHRQSDTKEQSDSKSTAVINSAPQSSTLNGLYGNRNRSCPFTTKQGKPPEVLVLCVWPSFISTRLQNAGTQIDGNL